MYIRYSDISMKTNVIRYNARNECLLSKINYRAIAIQHVLIVCACSV